MSIFGAGFGTGVSVGSTTNPSPASLGGVTVQFCFSAQANSCNPATLLFVSKTQINAVLPFQAGLYGSKTMYLTVTVGAVTTPFYSLKVYE